MLSQNSAMLLIYKVQQYSVQEEMQQTLGDDHAQFQKITLSLPDYEKGKINSHEISLSGKMYDIKNIRINGDSVELLAINDTDEENILGKIKEFITGKNHPNKELPVQLRQFLSLKFLPPQNNHTFLVPVVALHVFLPLNTFIISVDSEIHTPPPEFIRSPSTLI